MAVPPCGVRPDTACFAYCLVVAFATARLPSCGYTGCASWVPATTANPTPSRITSTAAAVAARASAILVCGDLIDPEQSMIMISAMPPPASAAGASDRPPADPVSGEVTVTIALTSSPPSGRYSFWATSTVKSGWLIGGLILCIRGDSRHRGQGLVVRLRRPRRERGEYGGDVVRAAGFDRERDQRRRRAERVGQRQRQGQLGELRRLGLVVPEPVRAQQHDAGSWRLEPGHVRRGTSRVRADPAGHHVGLGQRERVGLGHEPGRRARAAPGPRGDRLG